MSRPSLDNYGGAKAMDLALCALEDAKLRCAHCGECLHYIGCDIKTYNGVGWCRLNEIFLEAVDRPVDYDCDMFEYRMF